MPKFRDLTGQRFGRLVVIALAERTPNQRGSHWLCRCDCGSEKSFSVCNLGRNTFSCGCGRQTQGGIINTHRFTPRWREMINRCTDPEDKDYENYGARGINVCERWLYFPNFVADMEPTFAEGLTLDRIDNNGDYEPSNCRWATQTQQRRNTRFTVRVQTPVGPLPVGEAAERFGMNAKAIYESRRSRRKSPHAARLETPD